MSRNKNNNKPTKNDQGKAKISLVYPPFIIELAKALEHGDKKYGKGNWKQGLEPERILSALLRHALKISEGQYVDKDSGLSHMAHITANAMMLTYLHIERGEKYNGF